MKAKTRSKPRKRDLVHVELDAAHRAKFDKIHEYIAAQPALSGILKLTPSVVVRYAIGRAFAQMEGGNG